MEPKSSKWVYAQEFADECEIELPTAYERIRKRNKDLKKQGFETFSGRIPRDLFNELCYWKRPKEKDA